MARLRVAVFMRGSTNKQTSAGQAKKKARSGKTSARPMEDENDLPLQKQKCLEYIESKKDEWENTGLEYVEAGVSGFHTCTSKRVGLNQAFEDAKRGLFDVLLVYKLDRIGRRSVESLNHALKFLRYCKVWVVDKNREFTNSGDADEIMNFIEFWSAKKASMDTKVRVTDMMKLIHKEGYWTGGNPPYGYRNHPTMSNMLEIIPDEAKVVKEVYNLYINENYGGLKIARYLNEKGILSKTGRHWSTESINKILRNTVYKGYLSYGKTKTVDGENGAYQRRVRNGEESVSEKYWKEFDIVGEEVWNTAHKIKDSRRKLVSEGFTKGMEYGVPSRKGTGKGLLTGVLKCECGSPMTYSSTSDWLDKKRTKRGERYGIYRCLKRMKSGVSACGASKGTHKVEEVEKIVIDGLKKYTKELIDSELLKDIQAKTKEASKDILDRIHEAKANVERWNRVKEKSNNELIRIMMGEDSSFSENQLKEMYDKAVEELNNANKVMVEMNALNSANDMTEIDLEKLQEIIGNWSKYFDEASHEEKRRLITTLIKEVRLNGEEVELDVNLDITAFFEVVASLQTSDDGCAHCINKTSMKKTFVKPVSTTILLKVA